MYYCLCYHKLTNTHHNRFVMTRLNGSPFVFDMMKKLSKLCIHHFKVISRTPLNELCHGYITCLGEYDNIRKLRKWKLIVEQNIIKYPFKYMHTNTQYTHRQYYNYIQI